LSLHSAVLPFYSYGVNQIKVKSDHGRILEFAMLTASIDGSVKDGVLGFSFSFQWWTSNVFLSPSETDTVAVELFSVWRTFLRCHPGKFGYDTSTTLRKSNSTATV
jgi:hypothetical protein